MIPTFDLAYEYDPAFVPQPKSGQPELVWEMATMFPAQGAWTEEEYLTLTDATNRLIEFDNGYLEFLPVPTEEHQNLLIFLFDLLRAAAEPDLGKALFCGLRVKTGEKQFKEPDIVFMLKENFAKRSNRFWTGTDLAIEIVSSSPRDRARDYETEVANYAAAGVAEYWIVDPQDSKITVLTLPEGAEEYTEHGVFNPGQTATSVLLPGFQVDAQRCFDAAKS